MGFKTDERSFTMILKRVMDITLPWGVPFSVYTSLENTLPTLTWIDRLDKKFLTHASILPDSNTNIL